MKSTTLVELLRDISLRLNILIKTSELPPSTSLSARRVSVAPTQSIPQNQINSITTPSGKTKDQKAPEESTRELSTDQQPTTSSNNNQSMSTTPMMQTDLLLNQQNPKQQPKNDDNNNNSSQNYNYIYNKASSCNNRASKGSILEHDEVRSVIVTGCGSKIGRKIATAFARLDFNIALVDFDLKQTESVADECQESSPKNRVPLQIIADISQLDEAHKVIDRAVGQFGRLDVLVNTINNAALMEAHFTGGQSDDDPHVFEQYHRIIANNMHSVTYLCISAAPHLRRSKGSIVNVSSISENDHGSYKFAYCMSKAGIWTLTKCLATDYAPDINMICVSDQPTTTPAPPAAAKKQQTSTAGAKQQQQQQDRRAPVEEEQNHSKQQQQLGGASASLSPPISPMTTSTPATTELEPSGSTSVDVNVIDPTDTTKTTTGHEPTIMSSDYQQLNQRQCHTRDLHDHHHDNINNNQHLRDNDHHKTLNINNNNYNNDSALAPRRQPAGSEDVDSFER